MTKISNESHEIAERIKEAQHDSKLTPVALSMSVVAVIVALVSLLGHRAHTKEVLLQDQAGDQWAYFESEKSTVLGFQTSADLLDAIEAKDRPRLKSLKDQYQQQMQTHEANEKTYESKAKELEAGVMYEEHVADRLDLAEVCLEAALVIMSVTLLTRRRLYWKFGLVLGSVGLAAALSSFLVR